ncbi:MAG: nucleotidyltransferase domain-containing protein [Acidimicrobiia bacterium]
MSDPAEPPVLDAPRIVEVLNRHQVAYVVIGAYAAQLHGAPIRKTEDIDVTPSRARQNLDRLSQALKELGARVRTVGVPGGLAFDHDGASLGQTLMWNLTCAHGDFDISFQPSGTEGFDDLARDAVTRSVGDVPARVASLDDVIRSKRAAGRPKDLAVLPTLIATAQRLKRADQPPQPP